MVNWPWATKTENNAEPSPPPSIPASPYTVETIKKDVEPSKKGIRTILLGPPGSGKGTQVNPKIQYKRN